MKAYIVEKTESGVVTETLVFMREERAKKYCESHSMTVDPAITQYAYAYREVGQPLDQL